MTRWAWIGFALLVPACGGARAYTGGDAKAPELGLEPLVETDIQAGYARYAAVLARWGEWEQDDAYGVRWCPTDVTGGGGAPFVPYHARGHWAAAGQPMYGAPAGTPYWSSDDAETWGEITMHHGWWVREAAEGPRRESFCWVPGAEETPARVVWRTSDGFVGWAAEPPTWMDDGDEGLYADFEWSFCFVGGLLEDDLGEQYLTGDVQARAADATSRARLVGFHAFDRHGPPVRAVHVAREAIARWAQQHPELGASVALKDAATARVHAQPSVGAPAGGTTTASSGGADHGTKKRSVENDHLPNAMAMAPIMMTEPLPYGPLPRFVRVEPGATPSGYASTGEEAGASTSSGASWSSGRSALAGVSRGGWSSPHGASTWHASVLRSGGGGVARSSGGGASSGGGWHSSGSSSSGSSSSSGGHGGWHSGSGGHPASSHHGHGH